MRINSGLTEALKMRSDLSFVRVAHDHGAEVRAVFFVDGVRVPLAQDPDFDEGLGALSERRIMPLVCQRILEGDSGLL